MAYWFAKITNLFKDIENLMRLRACRCNFRSKGVTHSVLPVKNRTPVVIEHVFGKSQVKFVASGTKKKDKILRNEK